jgi:hypothetical protein
LFLGKIDTPSMPKEGEDFAYRADTDVSVHCDFILRHCGPTPKLNDDPVEDFQNGFATRHGVKYKGNRAHVPVRLVDSKYPYTKTTCVRLGAPDSNQS